MTNPTGDFLPAIELSSLKKKLVTIDLKYV
jgi:hypothetical protein